MDYLLLMNDIESVLEKNFSIKVTINGSERQSLSKTVLQEQTSVWRIITANGVRTSLETTSNNLHQQSTISPYFILLTNVRTFSCNYCSMLLNLSQFQAHEVDYNHCKVLLPVPMKKQIARNGDEYMCEYNVIDIENAQSQHTFYLYLYRVPDGNILSQNQYFAPETLHALGTLIAHGLSLISEYPIAEESMGAAALSASPEDFVDMLTTVLVSTAAEPLFDPDINALLLARLPAVVGSDHSASERYKRDLAQLATDTNQVMGGETLMRKGVGNFVADNIVTSLNAEGRPALVGIRSFEWGPSSRMDDLALAMLSVFHIDKDINRCPILQAAEILRGYVAYGKKPSKEEIQTLWPIIILRGMQNLLDSTSCKEGVLITAKETFKHILEIPFNFAQTMLMATAGHLPSLSSGNGMGLGVDCERGICLPKQWVEVDFSVTSSIYPSRWQEWFADADTEAEKDKLERSLVDYAVELTSQTEAIQAQYPSRKPVSRAVPHQTSIAFMVVSYGKALLYRSRAPSMVAPTNIPLYSKIVLKTQYNRIYLTAPFSIAETDSDLLTYASYGEGGMDDHSEVAGWAANKFQRVREQSILIRTPLSEETDILISIDKIGGTAIHISRENMTDSRFDPGSIFASIEFSSSTARNISSLGISVQLIPKPAFYVHQRVRGDALNSAIRKEFLPPKHCSGQYFDTYRRLCPNPDKILLLLLSCYHDLDLISKSPLVAEVAPSLPSAASPLALRYEHLAAMQEHYFAKRMNVRGEPATFLRGSGAYMFDSCGRAYLDMVNNVALVGHCHHLVVSAATEQYKLLNTNSRFIYPSLGLFTSRITQLMDQAAPLCGKKWVVFLVNSGSEATDLALRIARSVANHRRKVDSSGDLNRNVVSLCGGYHGVTTAADEVSTTLNDNPRSLLTRPPWIHLVPLPNMYRGLHRLPMQYMYRYSQLSDLDRAKIIGVDGCPVSEEDYNHTRAQLEEEVAEKYADYVRATCSRLSSMGVPPCAFICEPLSGNAGGVLLPEGYLRKVYHEIRKVGGFCICDVVQVGYGRLSTKAGEAREEGFWGFEEHGVCPDIVTMAKAAGNGHALGFVLVQSDIAEDFKTCEGSFFSSAGGGPVSCAVGLAVLQAIEEDNLQANAVEVGDYLNKKLISLSMRYPNLIGCIHGHGLYQGIEIVDPSKSGSEDGVLPPGSDVAYAVCDRLRELGVLCHGTGDYSNVLKVKPPMCISKDDADFFVSALTRCCEEGW